MRETSLPGEEGTVICSRSLLQGVGLSVMHLDSQSAAKKPEMKWKLLGLSITVELLSERNKKSTSLEWGMLLLLREYFFECTDPVMWVMWAGYTVTRHSDVSFYL